MTSLEIVFQEKLSSEEIDEFFKFVARGIHCRINYFLEEKRHVGTINPEAEPNEFITKRDILGVVRGTVIGYYVVPFTLLGHQTEGYWQMDCEPPIMSRISVPEWPSAYYDFIDEIRSETQNYFRQ